MTIEKVVSGGQTGADRAALVAAIALKVPHGGWCPRKRRAEDGPIPPQFQLQETSTVDYPTRTEWNIRDSDGTLVFTFGTLDGGSALTVRSALRQQKPCLYLDLDTIDDAEAAAQVLAFVWKSAIKVLNVAGNRESKAPGIASRVEKIMTLVLSAKEEKP